jgi:hypothetical protein
LRCGQRFRVRCGGRYMIIAQLPMETGGDTLMMEFDRQVP